MTCILHGDELDRANVDELLQTAADPAELLVLIIAKLEAALAEARSLATDRLADRHSWRRKMADASSRRTSWAKEAEVATSAGRDDLAKGALLKRQRAFDEVASLAGEASLIEQIVRDSDEDISRLQSLLRELKSRNVPVRRRLAWQ